MALKLRRGTDVERQAITPEAGEPIWVDNNTLYVGDGSTQGGIKITGDINADLATASIGALSDVDTSSVGHVPSDGDSLLWHDSMGHWMPGTPSLTLDDISNVNLTSNPPTVNQVLSWSGTEWVPQSAVVGTIFDGDIIGSVFGDDSTLIVDGINNTVTPLTLKTGEIVADKLDPFSLVNNSVEVSAQTLDDVGIRLRRLSAVADAVQTDIGSIYFDGIDKNNEDFQSTASYIITSAEQSGADPYLKSKLIFGVIGADGNATGDNQVTITWDGNVGMGTSTPSAKLDVQGPILPGVYADATARDAAITSPVAGMMIFVTDVAKFQGNTDGTITGWVNLN
jgi:hypothetical protein